MTPKDTLLRALGNYRGDDLYRARAAFRGKSDVEMQQQYGQSGQTCAQILAGYEEHERLCDEAAMWLARQS